MKPLPTIPQDPQLDAMLDEALAPQPTPDGLDERIIAATQPKLAESVRRRPSVTARLNRPGLHLAAAVALLVLVAGQVFWFGSGSPDSYVAADPPVDPVPPVVAAVPLPEPIFEERLDWLASAELDARSIDDRIDVLSMQLTMADSPGLWSDSSLNSLDNAIARHEMDEVSDDIELFF